MLFFCPICKQATTTRKTVTISIYETRKKVLQVILISELFSGEVLSEIAIQRIFEQEVYEVRKPGTYMGAWQMAALANVLNTPLRSVYPLYGGQTVRKDLNINMENVRASLEFKYISLCCTKCRTILFRISICFSSVPYASRLKSTGMTYLIFLHNLIAAR
jgi:hypothetical protein